MHLLSLERLQLSTPLDKLNGVQIFKLHLIFVHALHQADLLAQGICMMSYQLDLADEVLFDLAKLVIENGQHLRVQTIRDIEEFAFNLVLDRFSCFWIWKTHYLGLNLARHIFLVMQSHDLFVSLLSLF